MCSFLNLFVAESNNFVSRLYSLVAIGTVSGVTQLVWFLHEAKLAERAHARGFNTHSYLNAGFPL